MGARNAAARIRPYDDADWERVCQVHDAARRDELRGSVDPAVYQPLAEVADEEGLFDCQIWVSEDRDGVVNGFVAATDDEVTWLYVDPAAYRQGLGRTLLRHALETCGTTVSVMVLAGNDAARTLYESEGFETTREVTLRFDTKHSAQGVILQRTASSM